MKKPRKDGAYIRVQRRVAEKRAERGRKSKISAAHENSPAFAERSIQQAQQKIKLPERFDLARNFVGVVEQINRLRNVGKKTFSIDFSGIRSVDAPAALMLAAELEVVKIRDDRRYVADDHKWAPDVRRQLMSMGLFDLLQVRRQQKKGGGELLDEMFVQFVSGFGQLKSHEFTNIISRSESLWGHKMPGVVYTPLFDGISEAALNTLYHAYPDAREDETARWWVSASVNKKSGEIKVICYDRGATIPKTIRDSEDMMKQIMSRLKGKGTDKDIIYAAMRRRQTSSKEKHRGHGLMSLRNSIAHNGQGVLEIYSGRGAAKYRMPARKGAKKYSRHRLKTTLHGTLVIWSIIPSTRTGQKT